VTQSLSVPTYAVLAELTGPETWTRGRPRFVSDSVELETFERYDPRSPATAHDLLFELAAVQNKRDIPAFARQFGLLLSPDPHTERISDWLATARDLRAALTMYTQIGAIAAADSVEQADELKRLKTTIAPYRASATPEWRALLDQFDLPQQANILIAEIANAHLPAQGIMATALLEQTDAAGTWRIATGATPDFLWGPRFDNLVELAHHMLALTIVMQVPIRTCAGCPRVFVPDPPNKRYHDERCASRARQRAKRTRAKDESAA
jgi:hypothetical protein